MNSWDNGLAPEQKKAASIIGQHARLLAGPGTGKTWTLTKRILWLITENNIPPEQILVLTFTRVAASKLRRNVEDELKGTGIESPRISTLHSFALRQILRNASSTRLPQPLRIADDYEEQEIIIKEISGLIGKNIKETKKLLNELSTDWEKLTADTTGWEQRFPNPQFLGAWKEHREVYGYTLRAELVYQLKRELEEKGDYLNMEGPPKYVLVDEYQDLNACDLSVIKSLAELNSEIYSAGDDDQSIYGFRSANPDGIRKFTNEYNPSVDLKLKNCHRCSKEILDYGLFVAKQDTRRIDKPIKATDKGKKGEVQVLKFENQCFEAEGIARLCYWLINSKNILAEEILILLRTDKDNKFSKPLRTALEKKGIPVGTASNPLEPLNHEQCREMLCLMQLTVNKADHLAWRTILTLGNSGIGKQTFANLYDLSRRKGMRFSNILQEVKESPGLLPSKGNLVSKKVKEIESLLLKIGIPEPQNLDSWINNLASEVIQSESERQEVINLFSRVRELGKTKSLKDLLSALNVSLNNQEQEMEKGKVIIMTMHQAKGLSADAVILAAAEDEYIPGLATGEAIDDERRLLFVSLTRAREYLYVTFCEERTGQQCHSGRTAGESKRTFNRFLSGGPHIPQDGSKFISNLLNRKK